MCSIRGTNNQLPNRFYKFAYLQLFKFKFTHLQLFDVKSLFPEKHILCQQKRTATYGSASLVSAFKFIQENDDLLSSIHN